VFLDALLSGIAGSPGKLYHNYRSYHAAMHSRLDLCREGFGSQTLEKLIGIGKALVALGWLWWRAWVPFDAVVAAAVCVAGVCRRGTWRHRGDIDLHFVWQAWHSATSTCTLRGWRGTYGTGLALVARLGSVWRRCRRGCLSGRRGTWRHQPSLCVAGVAPGDIDLHFVWQVWHTL